MVLTCGTKNHPKKGFTLVETLLSVVILALGAPAIVSLYISGVQAAGVARDGEPLIDYLGSQMEELLSRRFDQINSGSTVITVAGQTYTITWTAVLTDLDEDTVPEPNAKQVTVTLDDRSLTTLVVDTQGKIGKL